MKLHLSHEEMLAMWRRRRGYGPLRADCAATRTDGLDLDALLTEEMRRWYLTQLDTAPAELLEVEDISDSVRLVEAPEGVGVIVLPEGVRRVVEVRLGGWSRPARIADASRDEDRYLIEEQLNPFSRGGCTAPVAVKEHGLLRLYSRPDYKAHPAVERLLVVMEPEENTYIIDERLIPIKRDDDAF